MMDTETKHFLDFGSAAIAVTTIVGWLPNIAALLTIIWTAIRIVESKTFQRVMQRLLHRK